MSASTDSAGDVNKPIRAKHPKSDKALAKLRAKQTRRGLKSDQLPDPALNINLDDYTTFAAHLRGSRRILALLGAGLSAASGIPTFRGAGGFWLSHDATQLATPQAFFKDPSLVWQFYHHRRLGALRVRPNRGHFALAELARRRGSDFLAITQNIDGLSERAGHSENSLLKLHGTLHEVHCSSKKCSYRRTIASKEQLCPALNTELFEAEADGQNTQLSRIPREELPVCPECSETLRPSVVWFGEPLPDGARDRVHDWLDEVPKVDLMLVVGTSAVVFPAAAYIHAARVQGARIAFFNTEEPSEEDQENPVTRLREGIDWFFKGSAAEVLPEVLKETIGSISETRMAGYQGKGQI